MPTYALDGVIVTCPDASPGTGDLTLGDPVNATGRTLAAAISEDSIALPATFFYTLYEDGDIFEAGTAQVSLAASVYTLARSSATVIASSNSGSKISAAGNGATQVHFTTPEGRLLRVQDRGSNGGTLAETDQGQTFTGNQNITGDVTIQSIAATADEGPLLDLDRFSASPADDDLLGALRLLGRDSGDNAVIFGKIYATAIAVADGSEAGQISIAIPVAGTLTNQIHFGPTGAYWQGETAQGANTISLPSTYVNGVEISGNNTVYFAGNTASGAVYGYPGRDYATSDDQGYEETEIQYCPVFIGNTLTIDSITVVVSNASFAWSKVRLGIYNNSGGKPGSLRRDCGVVDASTNGTKTITGLSQSLPAGWYWLAAITNGDDVSLDRLSSVDGSFLGIEGASYYSTIDPVAAFSSDTGVTGDRHALKPDGTKIYGIAGTTIYQRTMSTAWDETSVGSETSVSVSTELTTGSAVGLCFNSDGTKMYVAEDSTDIVYQYTLSTAWDVTTRSYDSKSIDLTTNNPILGGIGMADDDTTFYAVDETGSDHLEQYTLSTASDISTASLQSGSTVVDIPLGTANPMLFDSNNKMMAGDTIWALGTAKDARTATIITQINGGTGTDMIGIKSDGTKIFRTPSSGNVDSATLDLAKAYANAGMPDPAPALTEATNSIDLKVAV